MRFLVVSTFILFSVLCSSAQQRYDRRILDSIGAWNAVRKAHQMTDIPISPVKTFVSNSSAKSAYIAGENYKGVIYSSAKETNTFVGQDVSIHTFMTALRNPRSVMYTEKTDAPPYHGKNCRAYYGTVCSGMITYALGFKITQRSSDILVDNCFELVSNQSIKGVRLADLICKDGHPRLVTGIEKNRNGEIKRIEISFAANSGCKRYFVDGKKFNKWLKENNYKIYRYKYLYKNTEYKPANNFVAVEDEKLLPYKYNDDICANKGDKSLYVTGEEVVLNVLGKGEEVEIYKDAKLYKTIKLSKPQSDVKLKGYPYGDYKACVVSGNRKSDYTQWKIIDASVRIDKQNNRIYFSSANAVPVYYEFCNISGGRPTNKKQIYAAEFTEEDKGRGYVTVTPPQKPTKAKAGNTLVKVHFECDYGMAVNKPINWYE